ncbi:hypothetical protein ACFVOO_23955 [Streptomyces rochei]|uniref:hypothetical protein n=1 Tax=Streptomyces rochei TaxID=1928 RepID=UPI0036CF593A
MTRHSVKLQLRPPTRVERLWYRRLRIPAPLAITSTSPSAAWVRLLPQSWTAVHRRYATNHGYYWLPCTLCNRPYGGHQSAGSIPDPTADHPGAGVGICPRCTRAGRSWRVPHPLEAVLDEIYDRHEHGHDPMRTDCVQCLALDAELRDAFKNHQ